jgi:hypothetical protein
VRWLAVSIVAAILTGGLLLAQASSNATHTQPPPRRPVHRVVPPARHEPARPPQFIVASFDGSGGAQMWAYWRAVARRAHAHFTFFVSGVYLLDWAHHDGYAPPHEPRGDSAIGFAPNEAWIAAMRKQIALGYREGNEVGTHFNGHFCGSGGVGVWSARDWGRELDQFDKLLFAKPLPFRAGEVVGDRTPCLEGNLAALYPVLAKRGFRYDASQIAPLGTWPSRRLGLWSVPLLELPFIGHTFRVVSMDYNFMANQISEPPAQIENEMYRTLWNAFRASYLGNRAPLSLGNHFEAWEDWAYDKALSRFLERACRLPEVSCTAIRSLVDWLDRESPKRLARFRAGRFPHARPAVLDRR